MNGTSHDGKSYDFEKTYPGCLGRMVNLFELNIGVAPNRLLTDKPHQNGFPVSGRRSDVSRMSPSLDQEEKVIVSESRNTSPNRKSNVTPMKMLIAQEMSKEVDSRRSPPNLVAKLMGLDAFPQQEPEPAMKRTHCKGHSRSHSELSMMSNWEQQDRFFQRAEPPNEYKDVYEIWEQPQNLPHIGKYNETPQDKKMALVRQKFVEAKRLSMDGRLRQSKQYQDALQVLSSNKDLFLRCLQEPNSVIDSLSSIPPPPETKRITVLRPSKMADVYNSSGERDVKQLKKGAFTWLNGSEKKIQPESSPSADFKNYGSPTQPTRIVVLKPNMEKIINDKSVSSPQSQSARRQNENFFGDVEDSESQESKRVAKAITNQIREKLTRHNRDENVTRSVFPNGYVADESSFSKSEIEFPAGNHSDSEAMSPVSRHSWDYVNQLGSPFSSSSFSRASYSPESSVCREAKKRLSERWASMASNGSCQEQRNVRRSSSTLGEMLALSETKKVKPPAKEGVPNEGPKDLNNLLISEQRVNEDIDNSPRNLTRSKSLPVSSSQFGTRLDTENSVSNKGEVSKEDTKARSIKSSFKGKVSSLFFSRNKKASKEKSVGSETKDETRSFPGDISCDPVDKISDQLSPGLMELSSKTSASSGMISPEAQFYLSKSVAFGIPGENQDQPSPISVLDPPFELNERTSKVFPRVVPDQYGYDLPLNSISSNLIDKSPPIGSIARTLSWDDSTIDTASSYPSKEPLITRDTDEEQQEWYLFVKTLLSAISLQDEAQPNTLFARWHSPENPLDPSLRDKYINLNENKTRHEAKRRQKRSTQKLVFDCTNAVLVELTGYGSGPGRRAVRSCALLDEVWARMDAWFRGECVPWDCGEYENGLVVERVVRREVAAKPAPVKEANVSETPKGRASAGIKRRGSGGLNKVCGVSPKLQAIVGEPALPRTEIVRQLWAYIRKHNLQDPGNKRKIICDDALRLVLETDCTDMFKMNKLLTKHILPLDSTRQSDQAKKIKVEDDSEKQSPDVRFVPVIISDALANFFRTGEREMLQSEALGRVWEYIKVNQLEDPLSSMVIHCDAKLQELVGCESISALGIQEMLVRHHLSKQ